MLRPAPARVSKCARKSGPYPYPYPYPPIPPPPRTLPGAPHDSSSSLIIVIVPRPTQEYCDGGTLRDALIGGVVGAIEAGGAPAVTALTLALDVALGMVHIHAKQVQAGLNFKACDSCLWVLNMAHVTRGCKADSCNGAGRGAGHGAHASTPSRYRRSGFPQFQSVGVWVKVVLDASTQSR